MRFSFYRALTVNQARELIVSVAQELVERINSDSEIRSRKLLTSPFHISGLYLEIRTDNVISKHADVESVQRITLNKGTLTYQSYPASELLYGRTSVYKESFEQALMFLDLPTEFDSEQVQTEAATEKYIPFSRRVEPAEVATFVVPQKETIRRSGEPSNMLGDDLPDDLDYTPIEVDSESLPEATKAKLHGIEVTPFPELKIPEPKTPEPETLEPETSATDDIISEVGKVLSDTFPEVVEEASPQQESDQQHEEILPKQGEERSVQIETNGSLPSSTPLASNKAVWEGERLPSALQDEGEDPSSFSSWHSLPVESSEMPDTTETKSIPFGLVLDPSSEEKMIAEASPVEQGHESAQTTEEGEYNWKEQMEDWFESSRADSSRADSSQAGDSQAGDSQTTAALKDGGIDAFSPLPQENVPEVKTWYTKFKELFWKESPSVDEQIDGLVQDETTVSEQSEIAQEPTRAEEKIVEESTIEQEIAAPAEMMEKSAEYVAKTDESKEGAIEQEIAVLTEEVTENVAPSSVALVDEAVVAEQEAAQEEQPSIAQVHEEKAVEQEIASFAEAVETKAMVEPEVSEVSEENGVKEEFAASVEEAIKQEIAAITEIIEGKASPSAKEFDVAAVSEEKIAQEEVATPAEETIEQEIAAITEIAEERVLPEPEAAAVSEEKIAQEEVATSAEETIEQEIAAITEIAEERVLPEPEVAAITQEEVATPAEETMEQEIAAVTEIAEERVLPEPEVAAITQEEVATPAEETIEQEIAAITEIAEERVLPEAEVAAITQEEAATPAEETMEQEIAAVTEIAEESAPPVEKTWYTKLKEFFWKEEPTVDEQIEGLVQDESGTFEQEESKNVAQESGMQGPENAAEKVAEVRPSQEEPATVVKQIEDRAVEQEPAAVTEVIEEKIIEQEKPFVVERVEQEPVAVTEVIEEKVVEQEKPFVAEKVEQEPEAKIVEESSPKNTWYQSVVKRTQKGTEPSPQESTERSLATESVETAQVETAEEESGQDAWYQRMVQRSQKEKQGSAIAQEPPVQEPLVQEPLVQEPLARELQVQELQVQELQVQELPELSVREPASVKEGDITPSSTSEEIIAVGSESISGTKGSGLLEESSMPAEEPTGAGISESMPEESWLQKLTHWVQGSNDQQSMIQDAVEEVLAHNSEEPSVVSKGSVTEIDSSPEEISVAALETETPVAVKNFDISEAQEETAEENSSQKTWYQRMVGMAQEKPEQESSAVAEKSSQKPVEEVAVVDQKLVEERVVSESAPSEITSETQPLQVAEKIATVEQESVAVASASSEVLADVEQSAESQVVVAEEPPQVLEEVAIQDNDTEQMVAQKGAPSWYHTTLRWLHKKEAEIDS